MRDTVNVIPALMTLFSFLLSLLSGMQAHAAQASRERIALVFGGDGTENDDPTGTLYSAVYVTRLAGFEPVIITDKVPQDLLSRASVWIQPGGPNFYQSRHMLRTGVFQQVKDFVAAGGGFVGFCGGGYMAQSTNGYGLGLLPGNAYRHDQYTIKTEVSWKGQKRFLHFEHGPQFERASGVEVVATYSWNGAPAAVRGQYGGGKVFLSGPHPEALDDWEPVVDPDGTDHDLAIEMIQSAAAQ